MMSKNTVFSFSFFFFFVLLFLGISFSINNIHSKSEEKVKEDFQEKVLIFSHELTANLQNLSETLLEKGMNDFEEQALTDQKEGGEHFAYYLYLDHQLKFWTNNQLLISDSDSLLNTNVSCMKIGPYWMIMKSLTIQNYTLIGVKILQVDYKLQNEFLHDVFLQSYNIREDLKLSKERGKYEITDESGNFLFSFTFKESLPAENQMPYLLFFVFILAYLFFAFSIDAALKKIRILDASAKILAFSAFCGIYLLFFVWIGFPSYLFDSALFQPQLYANPSIYSSLGQIFLISIWLFSSILYYTEHFHIKIFKKLSVFSQISLTAAVLLILTALYYGLYTLLVSLIFDSQINLEITAITNLSFYSYTVLILIMVLQLCWFLLSKKLIEVALANLNNKLIFILFAFIIALIFRYLPQQTEPIKQFNQLFLFVYFLSFYYLFSKDFQTKFWQNAYFLLLFISITGIYYVNLSVQKEEAVRKAGLSTYLMKNDPLLESNFLKEKQRILSDSILLLKLNDSNYTYPEVIEEINQKYFLNTSRNYVISMVFCDAESKLLLLPAELETPCFPFFSERISQAVDIIEKNSLYLVDQHFRTKNYIGIIEFIHGNTKTKLYVEFLSKYQPKELGMPALLSDAKNWDLNFFSNYAYAYYFDGDLSEWFGKYDYKQNLELYNLNLESGENQFTFEGYSHYIYIQDDQNILIVSKPKISLLEQIASLAFLFIFYGLNISGIFLVIYLSQNFSHITFGFHSRLQINMVAILLFSFFTIGLSNLYYLYYLNDEKNKSALMEKAHSVIIELEHKLQGIDDSSESQSAYLESLMLKFSQIFFTDINLFDTNGILLATSRTQLFDSELISHRMEPNAFYNLGVLKSSLFMHKEKIGLQEFYSVYIPFRSINNKTVAYLNLPYFAKQNELEEEISGFLVAYLNIYMFLIILSLGLTILISNYLSKPLLLLKEKIQGMRLESPNEKIEWNKDDEIGVLIMEYNRMVEELTESAEKLARSQRESAWREMAQQIAHEIKNPLTPMKLNIQYLEKVWKEGGEDFDEKLSRIAHNITEQIDNLSDIASQFSSFASLEEINAEIIPVKSMLMSSIDLFSVHKNIDFKTSLPNDEVYILADRNQFIRILNNLLKNAIQSINEIDSGQIGVELLVQNKIIKIEIADNGCGISDDEKSHIFEPRFTTKSGGMGLGLALVKKMTENANGSVRFESNNGKGTRFILEFPQHPMES